MRIRNVLLFSGCAVALMTLPAAADPVSAGIAILTYVGIGAETAGAITTFLVATVLSTGLSYLAKPLPASSSDNHKAEAGRTTLDDRG